MRTPSSSCRLKLRYGGVCCFPCSSALRFRPRSVPNCAAGLARKPGRDVEMRSTAAATWWVFLMRCHNPRHRRQHDQLLLFANRLPRWDDVYPAWEAASDFHISWSGVLFWFLQKPDVWKVVPTYLQNILLTSFWITVIMHICLVDYSSFTVFYQRRQIRFLIVFLTLIPSRSIPSRRTVAYRCLRWIDSPAHRACRKRWLWRRHPNLIESSDLFTLCSLPSRGYCWAGAHTHTRPDVYCSVWASNHNHSLTPTCPVTLNPTLTPHPPGRKYRISQCSIQCSEIERT